MRLSDVFDELGWPKTSSEDATLFADFCALLSRLDPQERDLLLELTKDFTRVTLANYEPLLNAALSQLLQALPTDVTWILSGPLLKPQDEGRVKSGALAGYLFRAKFEKTARGRDLHFLSFDRVTVLLDAAKKVSGSGRVVLLDDFVGSGTTALEVINVVENAGVSVEQMVVVSIAMLQRGKLAIEQRGVVCFTGVTISRGISDSLRLLDKQRALKTMDSLEERMKVPKGYRRGWEMSEALICLLRCPNNTFPVYWTDRVVNGQSWPAPFLR